MVVLSVIETLIRSVVVPFFDSDFVFSIHFRRGLRADSTRSALWGPACYHSSHVLITKFKVVGTVTARDHASVIWLRYCPRVIMVLSTRLRRPRISFNEHWVCSVSLNAQLKVGPKFTFWNVSVQPVVYRRPCHKLTNRPESHATLPW